MLSSNTSGVSEDANYIESVFSTYLYTGNDTSQTITNGVDLSTKGGMVWVKRRSSAGNNGIVDTARGRAYMLFTNTTDAQAGPSGSTQDITSFNTDGFSIGTNGSLALNTAGSTYASWTFRKQPKFFDIVTYTGTGSARTVAHNLGSTPGCFIVKRTDAAADWIVYHRSVGATAELTLNLTDSAYTNSAYFNNTNPTSTEFTVGTNGALNASGATYVAYLFAHDAGGFGLTGTDNVISCGSYTGTGASGTVINLGYEPQWLLVKNADAGSNWCLVDNMRGVVTGGVDEYLRPNTSNAGDSTYDLYDFHATGFEPKNGYGLNNAANKYIYIAIRRGPMKVPTDATKVFAPVAYTGDGSSTRTITANFPVDTFIASDRNNLSALISYKQAWFDRILGNANGFITSNTNAWGGGWGDSYFKFDSSTGIPTYASSYFNQASTPYVHWMFRRAPSFFDEVCYTGTGSATTFNHNLGVAPELMIVKGRNQVIGWGIYAASLGATKYLYLPTTNAAAVDSTLWNDTAPTSTVFTAGTTLSSSGNTFVAYLFATCAGVSKVGSYTGTGTTQQVDCGFAAGARFVLIKRTDSTGDWYVWDTARGIVSGNDPYLLLNSTAAEVTITDYIDTYSAGFELSTTAAATVNVIGGSFIFFAVA